MGALHEVYCIRNHKTEDDHQQLQITATLNNHYTIVIAPPEQTLLLHLILQSVHSKAKRQRQSVNILVDTAIIKIVLLRRKNRKT